MKSLPWLVILFFMLLGAGLCSCKTEVREGDTKWNEAVAPFRKSLDLGGYTLRYLDMGSGEPVVLIHGFADSTYSWHSNAFALKDAGNRLIIVDQPGHGLSDLPPEPYAYSVENQAKAIIDLTEKLGIPDFSLVGHGMGGGIAMYMTVNYPDKVRRVAVLDPVCYKPPAVQILRMPGMEYLATRYGGPYLIRMTLEDAFYNSDRLTETMVNEYSRPIAKPGYWKMLISIEKDFYSPQFYAMAQSLPKIQKPALIIWGKQDTWVTQEEGRKLHDEIYNSTLYVLDKCGHYPQLECSLSVNPLLVDFLKEAGHRVDQFLITPGEGIGDITLGMTRDKVKRIAGKPISSTKTGDQFEGYIVRYQEGRVFEILITSPSFRTAEGIATNKPVDRFLASYPDAKNICYETKSGGFLAQGVMRDALEHGLAYDWNSYMGKRQVDSVTLIIHDPNVPAQVFGNVLPCQGATPAGK